VGIVVKIPGHVDVDPVTGQLTGVFDESPQLPFSDLKLTFKSGPRAPVALPASCGSSSTAAVLEPWSHAPSAGEVAGTPDAVVSDSFDVSEGCGARGFAPGFVAGTVDPQADGFSSFATSFSRSDSDQDLDAISVTTPPGLLGVLASVPLCGEPQAGEGKCSAASQIGHTVVTAGPGSAPLTVPEAGQPQAPVYLTTGYRGAPFGLSIVVPAVAGPFNLGDVVVRAAISVNPVTSQVTITSDPLPQTLDGIPLQTRTVDVSVDRPGFIFNPTNCSPSSVTGMIASAQGTTAGVSSPFEAANCATLPFKPVFSASVAGKASKAGGAALSVKVASKGGPEPGGGEANIRSVKVDLPIQLPSRQSTLKLACLAATFEANPAGCPTEADVGVATVSTPVLAHPLTGPAYLVSHGGAAFPDLEIVLQGEGIRLVLDGNTVIKKGITSSIFKTVPDAPISKFELRLPTGKYSILAAYLPNKANYSFCGQTLNMPTEITGQNGAVIKQTTKIAVTGCPKAKKTVKHKTTTKKKKKG
jgi:hypothetical protein